MSELFPCPWCGTPDIMPTLIASSEVGYIIQPTPSLTPAQQAFYDASVAWAQWDLFDCEKPCDKDEWYATALKLEKGFNDTYRVVLAEKGGA